MAGSNPYLPLFEPTIDTFDSVRSSSTLLFTAVLLIASKTESGQETFSKRCHEEASRLSADSLFSSPARLESVQALLLLAAWSEKPWFALGHAVNMAKDLGLHQILSTPSNNTTITRQARTWLILYHLEREIAFGTAREPQLASLEEKQPEYLLNCNRFRHIDLRFLSIIKLVQIRESLQKGVRKEKSLPLKASSLMRDARARFDKWECFWDLQHKEYGYCTSSFQRSSLTVQKSYATVLVCCTILSELQKEGNRAQPAASFSDMAKETLQAVTDHLKLIMDQTAFKWQLQFSPTYSALTVAFSACLALTLSKTHSGITQQRRLVDLARKISALLKAYPNQKFHLLLESFLVSFQQFSEEGHLPSHLDPEPLQTTASVTGPYSARSPQEHAEVAASVLGSLQEREDQCADPLAPADTLHYKQLEAMLELPPESWFLDPFSAEALGFEDN
ncbi:Transcription factor fungi [Macrophomina phaseolina MS6]|uniref:Transcription factor fungi n=1 Tax=Macrophomina phaseolina (strain MS6) TaxID=1126212 RepID=K2QL18_MACPH|nr:Transcription factor fungi [Macrophomina phaseolina MS6]